MQLVRDVAGDRHPQLELNALVQRVVVTDHRRQAAEELARRWTQLSPEEILQSPYVLIGTVDKQIEDLHARRERWGISYYVIFEPYVDAFAPVVARLAGVRLGTRRISSAVRDHDLPEMAAALEMLIGRLGLGEGERLIDHRAQPMQRDSPVHRLKIRAAPDADRSRG